jgi:hypothetical protein
MRQDAMQVPRADTLQRDRSSPSTRGAARGISTDLRRKLTGGVGILDETSLIFVMIAQNRASANSDALEIGL